MPLLPISVTRLAACSAWLLAGAAWIGAGALPWLSERRVVEARSQDGDPESLLRVAWLDAPARARARRALPLGHLGRDPIGERLLEHSVRARPLYAPTWLARAELAHRRGLREPADRFARLAAALWPHRERLLWKAAVLRAQMGDRKAALELLGSVLRANPPRAASVVAVAAHLQEDPALWVESLVPPEEWGTPSGDERLIRILWVAVGGEDGRLASEIWQRLSPAARARRNVAGGYVDALVASGRIDEALPIWRRYGTAGLDRDGISNPGFEEGPALGGLGWRLGAPPGARWSRDPEVRHGGRYSLRVSFDGSENLAYDHAAQITPVRPGGHYRLSGYWRGRGVTTRSGLYLEVVPAGGASPLRVATESRIGDWGWERFELRFRAPADARVVMVRLRRDAREDSDRGLSGRVWIDDFALLPVAAGDLRG